MIKCFSRTPLTPSVMIKITNILRNHMGKLVVSVLLNLGHNGNFNHLTFISATSNHIKCRKKADCSQHPATALICLVERLNYSLVLLLVRGE